MNYLTTGSPGKELTRHHQQSGKSQIFHSLGKIKWRPHVFYHIPEAFSLTSTLAEQCVPHQEGSWVRMISQGQPANQFHQRKTLDCESRGRAVLLGSLTILASAWALFPSKAPYFLSKCVSLDSSFPSVRRESPFWALEGVPLPGTFLLLSPDLTTETQGHEVSKARIIKGGAFWPGPGDQNKWLKKMSWKQLASRKQSTICDNYCSVTVMSDSLRPHGLQHIRRPCPSLLPWVYSDSRQLSDAIQPSHPLSPLLFLPSIFPSIKVFYNESALHIRLSIGVSASASVIPVTIQGQVLSE